MLKGVVIGGDAVVARYNRMPDGLRAEMRRGIGRAVLLVQRQSKQQKLSDQVLHVRTGRLRRSINTRIEENAAGVTGIVGTNVKYARAHEFGFHGTVTVREHLRTVTIRAKVRGSAQFDPKTGKMRLGRSRTIELRGAAYTVRAHPRRVNLPERSFLRSALRDMREPIRLEFEQAAQRTLRPHAQ